MSQTSDALTGIAAWLEQRASAAPPDLADDWRARAKVYRGCIGLTWQQRQSAFLMNKIEPTFDASKLARPVLDGAAVAPIAISGPPDLLTIELAGELGVADLSQLEQDIARAKSIHLKIDCLGGDFMQALKLYRLLAVRNCRATVLSKCFSAAAFVLQAAKHRAAKPDAKLMLHVGQIFVAGTTRELRAAADFNEAITELETAVYRERTGQPPDTVAAWLAGPDRYFTASEALAVGLIDEILS